MEGEGRTDVQAAIRAPLAHGTARTLEQVRQLGGLVRALENAGVPVLPYKGPALSLQLYGDLALRNSTDLDLVVPKAHYAAARDVLLSLGFPPRGGHSRRQERALFSWLGHASFGAGSDSFVELHWRFAPLQFPFALDAASAIARGERLVIAGQPMTLMARDDLLVTLGMHGARHLYERLEWLAGVTLLLQSIDPMVASRRARELRASRMLLASAVVAQRVLGVSLESGWSELLAADPAAQSVGAAIAELVIAHGRDGTEFPGGASLQTLYARLTDSAADRVRSVVRAAVMPTEREWELVRLPSALTPLYRVVRPLRLLAIYGQRLLGRRTL
jgi:hypothetical protein